MYVVAGLQPDTYTLRLLDVPAHQTVSDRSLTKEMIELGLTRLDIDTVWDGSIEGSIRDAAGAAQADLELRNTDGTQILQFDRSAPDGSFHFTRLPDGGRYILLISPSGPADNSPYPRRYYPDAKVPQDARIFEIRGSGHIRDTRITLNRLAQRDLWVRVTWPNGQPVDNAEVNVAYEGSTEYENPARVLWYRVTDRAGRTKLRVFGDSRIRVQARIYQAESYSVRDSAVVELETATLPRSLDLVLSSSPKSLKR